MARRQFQPSSARLMLFADENDRLVRASLVAGEAMSYLIDSQRLLTFLGLAPLLRLTKGYLVTKARAKSILTSDKGKKTARWPEETRAKSQLSVTQQIPVDDPSFFVLAGSSPVYILIEQEKDAFIVGNMATRRDNSTPHTSCIQDRLGWRALHPLPAVASLATSNACIGRTLLGDGGGQSRMLT